MILWEDTKVFQCTVKYQLLHDLMIRISDTFIIVNIICCRVNPAIIQDTVGQPPSSSFAPHFSRDHLEKTFVGLIATLESQNPCHWVISSSRLISKSSVQ